MMRRGFLLALMSFSVATGTGAQEQSPAAARQRLALYEQELAFVQLLLDAELAHPSCHCVVRHVRVIDVARGTAMPDMRVEVRAGRIVAMVPDGDAPLPDGARPIDGTGRTLVPGLADMHVHQLVSASQHVLHLATGVTTVRDMSGFPWMLEWRARSRADQWLAPNMIVAGHILNAAPMGMYATLVRSRAQAVEAVRAQAAAGYDFIKIHNAVPEPLFSLIANEARAVGLPFAGHIPHGVSVAHAIGAGMRTLEHFKGYIDDRDLMITVDDWITPTKFGSAWNTPTLYAHRSFLRDSAAAAWFVSEEARYVPALTKARWRDVADEPVQQIHASLQSKQQAVMRQLLPHTTRFLAGTDAGGGYPFMVPGYALHEELRLLNETGLPALETLRAATLYAAEAAGRSGEFGEVAVGARADLLLVDGSPLDDLARLRRPHGVMLRGRWFDRAALDAILARLAVIAAETPAIASDASPATAAWADDFARRVRELQSAGYLFPSHHLAEMAEALRTLGHNAAADTLAPAGG